MAFGETPRTDVLEGRRCGPVPRIRDALRPPGARLLEGADWHL
jgi:hypothetical protein